MANIFVLQQKREKVMSKPVNCGCGGKPVVGHLEPSDRWYIGCPDCDICTRLYNTEIEVIKAWNLAMGAADIIVGDKERTAKVKDLLGRWGYCENCGEAVFHPDAENWKYCAYCGVRLEWE